MTQHLVQILHHLSKRGAQYGSTGPVEVQSAYLVDLKTKAALYNNSTFDDVKPLHVIAIVAFAFLAALLFASLKYTIGSVMATLAMIEEPRSLIISRTSANTHEGLSEKSEEKSALLDEEVLVAKEKPLTSSFLRTRKHLRKIGGRFGRWRGLRASVAYHMLHGIVSRLIAIPFSMVASLDDFLPLSLVLGSIAASVLLARIHMTWTHCMIAEPSSVAWFRRIPRGRIYFKILAWPSLVFAVAQQLTIFLPMQVLRSYDTSRFSPAIGDDSLEQMAYRHGIRGVMALATAAFVALAILLPASVTLTRVEASLLPEDQEMIVNFDRTLGGSAADVATLNKVNRRVLYDAAWRSFDKSSRLRLVIFYLKFFMTLAIVGVGSIVGLVAIVTLVGGDRLSVLAQSAVAQMQLAQQRN